MRLIKTRLTKWWVGKLIPNQRCIFALQLYRLRLDESDEQWDVEKDGSRASSMRHGLSAVNFQAFSSVRHSGSALILLVVPIYLSNRVGLWVCVLTRVTRTNRNHCTCNPVSSYWWTLITNQKLESDLVYWVRRSGQLSVTANRLFVF